MSSATSSRSSRRGTRDGRPQRDVFEAEICGHLEAHGWLYSVSDAGYDRERALFPEDLFVWLETTQKTAYEKALKAAGSQAKSLDVLVAALDKPLEHGGGTLNILRNGVQYIGGGRQLSGH